MRFKDVFSIIGPGMIGPSSSHTAGAVRLGRVARGLFGEEPKRAEIVFYGSLAATYSGHGTDLAVIAGLLAFDTDDERIPESLELAELAGMKIDFQTSSVPAVHPNTLTIKLSSGSRRSQMTGCSIGGGNIEVIEVNGFDLKFTANYPALIVYHVDRPGVLASLTRLLSDAGVNIGYMDVDRRARLGQAATVIEMDGAIPEKLLSEIKKLTHVKSLNYIDMNGGGPHCDSAL
ncbi:L-serine ammonia-lyase, iron-sulfur-dependent subunit beta [Paenibacillus sp. LHD-38]|uniref:L-serine ammonia-lyase, iron-sulfur-dependent subunit beta n=1 Tax=Paenibacillus sp. LHD-38 TaxID=3072143 RepID=UPI00280EDADB|nr:L-serine ammonia-lyase, iron-sulfur-dependent subunit beta [Paenibacillus sp. LHD-38]MDQ8735439.1 L-serine ammonia-lyase, iron-sulfur-dependent subunit beta [Paenibacillus sp. LHD-38]